MASPRSSSATTDFDIESDPFPIPLKKIPGDNPTDQPPLIETKEKQNPLVTSPRNLSFDTTNSDESLPGNCGQVAQQPSLRVELAPMIDALRDSRQYLEHLSDSTCEMVFALSTTEWSDEIFINDDEPSAEFSDPPTNVPLNSFGLICSLQPHVVEPPNDLYIALEKSRTYDAPGLLDVERLAVDRQVDDSTYQPDVVVQELLSLYHDYHQSIPAILSPSLLDPPIAGFSEKADVGAREQYAMSKNQVQLTLDEGSLWRSFVNQSVVDEADPREKLELLSRKSESLSKSYERRNNPPTPRTYEESRLILQAMGVPCVETAVPYEAEALAASLVHHGFADYVASEDTVRACCSVQRYSLLNFIPGCPSL